MFEWMSDPQGWVALGTLMALEIVLGVDNIIFISILSAKLPAEQQQRARKVGLFLAMFARIALLLSLSWLMTLTAPLFALFAHEVSGRDLILLVGGLFLMGKATLEIHEKLEGAEHPSQAAVGTATFAAVITQILLLDIVFSIDSVITAVGMVDEISIMVIAVIAAVIAMLLFVDVISDFVERRPTVKMLALSFLLLIGFALMGEGLHLHIPKGYIYFAMAFSVFVEMLNLKLRTPKLAPLHLRKNAVGIPED